MQKECVGDIRGGDLRKKANTNASTLPDSEYPNLSGQASQASTRPASVATGAAPPRFSGGMAVAARCPMIGMSAAGKRRRSVSAPFDGEGARTRAGRGMAL